MWSLLWGWWGQIWPNLVPITAGLAWHHRRIKAHITATAAAQAPAEATAAVPGARTSPPDGPVS